MSKKETGGVNSALVLVYLETKPKKTNKQQQKNLLPLQTPTEEQ